MQGETQGFTLHTLSLSKLTITFLASGRAQVASYRVHRVIKAKLLGSEAVPAKCHAGCPSGATLPLCLPCATLF